MDHLHFLLCAISFLTSAVSAVLGIGGGILLLAAMSLVVPIASLIPLHGVVQLSSNFSRACAQPSALIWSIIVPFALGGLFGASLGSFLLPYFVWRFLPPILGVLILLFTWLPEQSRVGRIPGKFFSLGAIQSFLSLFVGVSGPLNAPFLIREGLSRDQVVVTHAGQMTAVHLIKILTFGFLGFNYSDHALVLFFMILGAVLGSMVGVKVRAMIPEELFKRMIKYLLSILALRMIASPLF